LPHLVPKVLLAAESWENWALILVPCPLLVEEGPKPPRTLIMALALFSLPPMLEAAPVMVPVPKDEGDLA
jgi:hypothetical protein